MFEMTYLLCFVFFAIHYLWDISIWHVYIPIRLYLCDSCLYFLISICACVIIDIIN